MNPEQLESAWYIRTDATRELVGKVFGNVVFAGDTGSETIFITNVISGKIVEDLLGRGITANSRFRVLGDH
jgi:hypothetical protein